MLYIMQVLEFIFNSIKQRYLYILVLKATFKTYIKILENLYFHFAQSNWLSMDQILPLINVESHFLISCDYLENKVVTQYKRGLQNLSPSNQCRLLKDSTTLQWIDHDLQHVKKPTLLKQGKLYGKLWICKQNVFLLIVLE